MQKNSLLKKTAQVGFSTLISRILGLLREVVFARYLGPGAASDAFFTAFKIPNSLRKIFAEGALSAAFIPTFVDLQNQESDKHAVNKLMTLAFLLFEGLLIFICLLVFIKAEGVIRFITPGWFTFQDHAAYLSTWFASAIKNLSTIPAFAVIINYIPQAWYLQGSPLPQVQYAITYLRILVGFIVFLSSSALCASALQSVKHFFVPAISSIVLNVFWIGGILIAWHYGLPVNIVCWAIMLGGLVQFLLHIIAYFYSGFSFESFDRASWQSFKKVFKKFFPCIFSMSVMEINFFIDTSLGSYLSAGSISLIYYANRFMGIPLGVFAVAFSTILLPYFSQVRNSNPEKFNFYLNECTKFVVWVTLPISLAMAFFSDKIFFTLFFSQKFSAQQVLLASHILIAFVVGLFFFSLNKILFNIFYSYHDTKTPTIIAIISTIVNLVLNLSLMKPFQAVGLAAATTIAGIVQTILSLIFLKKYFNYSLDYQTCKQFILRYTAQLIVVSGLFLAAYFIMHKLLMHTSASLQKFLFYHIGFWLWVGPLLAAAFLVLYVTRKYFGINLYFLG